MPNQLLLPLDPCTCGPNCDDICRGDCGCEACSDAWGEDGVKPLPPTPRCPKCGLELNPEPLPIKKPFGKCCEKEYLRVYYGI